MNVWIEPTTNQSAVEKKWLRQAFCNAAPCYDGIAYLQKKVGRDLLGLVALENQTSKTILDVGCGTGFCMDELLKGRCNARFIGLDISAGMVQQAKHKLGNKAGYICGDAETLPLTDNSVDLILSNLTLQWCHNLSEVFSGFRQVLKPGGVLLFSSFGSQTLKELRDAWGQVDGFNHVNHFYKSEHLTRLMQNAGLTESLTNTQMHRIQYRSVLDLMRELKGIGAHNVTAGRCRGLTGNGRYQRMVASYGSETNGRGIWASYEVLFGKAIKCSAGRTVASKLK